LEERKKSLNNACRLVERRQMTYGHSVETSEIQLFLALFTAKPEVKMATEDN